MYSNISNIDLGDFNLTVHFNAFCFVNVELGLAIDTDFGL